MKSSFYLLIFSCLFSSCTPSVSGVLKSLGEKNYSKAKTSLDKRQQKNPNDVASLYGYSLYFSDSSNTQFDIDKAYQSIQRSNEMYHLANAKTHIQLRKRNINASTILSFQTQLERRAFLYFKKINTEQGFQEFINRFTKASQIEEAILERNRLAFDNAKKQHTYSAYQLFFEKYPDAEEVPQAKKHYEDLLFENKTKDGSLNSFVNFLKEHPKTPYRKLVERKIFELAITTYTLTEYENFVKNYPQNPYCQRAYQWIWHWNDDKNVALQKYSKLAQNQVLKQKLLLENVTLYPKEQNTKLIFEDNTGKFQINTELDFEKFTSFNKQERVFDTDIFIFKNSLNEFMAIDKSGKQIVGSEDEAIYNAIKPLHKALLKVRKGDKYAIFHKGGFQVSDFEFEEIDFINEKVLKFKKNNRSGLITPNNKTILNEKQQRISIFANQYLKLERGNEIGFADLTSFEFKKGKSKDLHTEFTFYDKRTFTTTHNQYLKIRKNHRYGISMPTGKIILHPSAEKIVETPSGWAAYFRNEWKFYSFWGKQTFSNRLTDIKINPQNKSLTYAVKRDDVWAILDTQFRQKTGFSYEKIDFIPHGAVLENEHGKFLYLGKQDANNYISIENYTKVDVFAFKKQHLITVQDSTNQTGLLNQKGELIFKCQYQNLTPLNAETILFNQNDKKGLIALDSTLILPAQYDAIANTQEGYFSLLRNGKLGLFDLENRKLIPCQYTALVQVLDKKRDILIAKKAKFGLINANNQVIAPFIFDEIREAQQNLIKVRYQNEWKYYNFVSKKFEKL